MELVIICKKKREREREKKTFAPMTVGDVF
jgi:hypothetical protein